MEIKEKDKESIGLIYEQMLYEDFLQIDESKVENYNWDLFWKHPDMPRIGFCILEGFEKIQEKKNTKYGLEDRYLITLRNGQTFESIITFWTPKYTKDLMYYNETVTKNYPITDIFEGLKNKLDNNEYMCMVQFVDSGGGHKATGKTGASSHELFAAVKDSFVFSIDKNDFKDNCAGIVARVDNSEIRRLGLYKMIFERYFKDRFPNIFIDEVSEKDDGMTLLYATI